MPGKWEMQKASERIKPLQHKGCCSCNSCGKSVQLCFLWQADKSEMLILGQTEGVRTGWGTNLGNEPQTHTHSPVRGCNDPGQRTAFKFNLKQMRQAAQANFAGLPL